MSMDQLMALVPIEAANTIVEKGRKSRWEKAKERKGGSRWGHVDDKPFLPPPYVDLPPGLTPAQMDQFLREQRYDELSKKLAISEIEMDDPDIRPPSPPPIYDKNGSRVNTRDVRARNAMIAEHQRLVEYMMKHVEGFAPPADFKPLKKIRRIEIPLEKYPEYNFMGLIIGPRGCNHKRLESESGAQISIRGKGTQKEGKKTDHQTDEEATLPMHVHVAADSEESVEKAVSLIEPLLDPCHPMHEEFKKRGLEQLALVNGVSFGQLDQHRCAVCGATGHLAHECPDSQQIQNFKKPEVKCAICGDMGHVTMDCKFAKAQPNMPIGLIGGIPPPPPPGSVIGIPPVQNPNDNMKIDSEYKRMMSTLTGDHSKINGDTSNAVGPRPIPPGNFPSPIGFTPIGFINTPPPGVSPMMTNPAPMNHFGSTINISPIPPPPPDFNKGEAPRPNDNTNYATALRPRGMVNIRAGIGHPDRAQPLNNIIRSPQPAPSTLPIRPRGSFPMNSPNNIQPNQFFVSPIQNSVPGQLSIPMPIQLPNQINGQNLNQIPNQLLSPFPGQFVSPIHHQTANHMQTPVNNFIPGMQQWPHNIPRPPPNMPQIGTPFFFPQQMIIPPRPETSSQPTNPPLPSEAPPLPPSENPPDKVNNYFPAVANIQSPVMTMNLMSNMTSSQIPHMSHNYSNNIPQPPNELNMTSPMNDAMDLSN